MSSSGVNLEKYQIPLKEIHQATKTFSSETRIGDGGFGNVHIGQLSDEWKKRTVAIKRLNPDGYQGNTEFRNELAMVSSFHHPNIIPFIGYCDDDNEMIIVFDYAVNGSLDQHLQNPDRRRSLTWTQRLKICLGAARGLKYLHSGVDEHTKVIHRDVKSANILLDENMEAKICDFGLSRFGARNQENTELLTKVAGTRYYMDPVYAERSRLQKESDVYSFGVVMFELSSGILVYLKKCFGEAAVPQYLIDVIRSYYDDEENSEGPDKLIDLSIRQHIDMRSFHIFNKLAHSCLNMKLRERPTMDQIIHKLEQALNIQSIHETKRSPESFIIPLTEIKLATTDFSKKKFIRDALFGAIYKGQHSELWQNSTMSITRLYPTKYKEKTKFYKEIQMISSFQHQNISRFIGYSDEANERIIVHEYAVNGSLRDYLRNSDYARKTKPLLSWPQCIKIWMGVARALQYLHLDLGVDNKAIRGNITCENVLLDQDMEAKICFFDLSKQNQSKPEPQVSDLYSLCIMLYEMIIGVKIENHYDERVASTHIQGYHRRRSFDRYINQALIAEIGVQSLIELENIAYRLADTWENPKTRISIDALVEMIDDATRIQD